MILLNLQIFIDILKIKDLKLEIGIVKKANK